jgi:hypothetical protein
MAGHSLGSGTPEHDQWGIDALERMVEDLDYPRTAGNLRDRIGGWRVPMPGGATVPMDALLEPFDDEKTFRSAKALVKTLRKRWPSLREPTGPWPGQDRDG